MRGNYTHEIFTGCIFGHYFFMMNEKVLELIFGKEYLTGEITVNLEVPVDINSQKDEKKGQELNVKESQDYETGEEDNNKI